jgi:choline kinase
MLLDNIEIRGIEELKEQSEEYAKESAQQKQQQQQVNMQQEQMKSQAQQMQMQAAKRELEQPTDNQIKIMELSEKSQKDAVDSSAKQRDSETKFIEVMSKIRNEQVDNELKAARIDAEENRSQVDAMISVSSHLNNLADKQ